MKKTSCLQEQTMIIGWPILISERTVLLVQGEFEIEFAALRALRGKSEPVKGYKVFDS
jgi:class 3 adenylate cyclase